MKPLPKPAAPTSQRSSYVQNKCIKIVPVVESGVSAFKIEAPIKGEGLRRTIVSSDTAPDAFKILTKLTTVRERNKLTVSAGEFDFLERLGFLVPVEKDPQRVIFSCNLEEAGSADFDNLDAFNEEGDGDRTSCWKINPNVRIQGKQEPPDRPTWLLRAFARLDVNEVAWIEDPCRHVTLPYWLTESEVDSARKLLSGELAVNEMDSDLRRKFAAIDLIFTERWLSNNRRKWQAKFGNARRNLARRGHAVIRDLIPAIFLNSVREYYRGLVAQGFLVFGDDQTARYNLHNEFFSRWLHRQTESCIYRAIPEAVKPSYSYVAVYPAGGTLEHHTDKIQCEYTLTLAIDATPDFTRADAWPLYVESPRSRRPVKVLLGPGDALILKGRELAHFRKQLGADRTSSSLLFHYVPADFEGPLLAGTWIRTGLAPRS